MALKAVTVAKKFSAGWRLVASLLIAATKSGPTVKSSEQSILFSCSDANRGMSAKDGLFSPLLSPIQEHYVRRGYETVNFSYPLSYYNSSAVRGGAIVINRPYILIWLFERIEKIFFGRDIAVKRKSERRVRLFKRLLVELKSSLVFATQATPEFCTAAHALGIAVIEPMHGMNLSPTDKILRATICGIDAGALPDAYLAFDDRTRDTLIELIEDRKIAVYRMPHPWHIECQDPQSTLSGAGHSPSLHDRGKKMKILISLQWGYSGERDSLSNIIPNGVLHPSIEQAIIANPDVSFLLRLHPVQLRGRDYETHRQYVQSLAQRFENVEWQDATTLPLPTILANIQGHITMSSGTCGEAAIFGVPSLLLCPTLKQGGAHGGWFSELIDDGMAELGVLDAAYINAWLGRIKGGSHTNKRKDWQEERRQFLVTLDQIIEIHAKRTGMPVTASSAVAGELQI